MQQTRRTRRKKKIGCGYIRTGIIKDAVVCAERQTREKNKRHATTPSLSTPPPPPAPIIFLSASLSVSPSLLLEHSSLSAAPRLTRARLGYRLYFELTHMTHRSIVHVPSKLRLVLPPYCMRKERKQQSTENKREVITNIRFRGVSSKQTTKRGQGKTRGKEIEAITNEYSYQRNTIKVNIAENTQLGDTEGKRPTKTRVGSGESRRKKKYQQNKGSTARTHITHARRCQHQNYQEQIRVTQSRCGVHGRLMAPLVA